VAIQSRSKLAVFHIKISLTVAVDANALRSRGKLAEFTQARGEGR
jgi:hypothetical protein